MTRKEFIKTCGILGIGLSQGSMVSCGGNTVEPNFSGNVLIIGAGAAGLSAAYLLEQQGVSYQIVEASSIYGGRMKRTTSFTDFPIPLGAEWLHIETDIFKEIINDETIEVNVNTIRYNTTDSYGLWDNNVLTMSELGSTDDKKFVNSSWLNFFDEYILPSIQQQITYNTIVNSINYTNDKIEVATQNGQTFTADKVIVTVPLAMLQENSIAFTPELANNKQNAINNATVWDGIKVFLEFSNNFYPTYLDFNITPSESGQKVYYNAAYGQNTNKHILGLFAVGSPSSPYRALTGDALKDFILAELDEIFSNQATPNYVQHIEQNWSNEPFIKGAYLNDHEDWQTVKTLSENLDDKIYFAGEAYTDSTDWAGLHTAIRAAKKVVEELVE